jgi:methionine synthase I (cobalamin-dependent)
VVEALTYYGHREKLRLVGKEDALEQLNLAALRIAKEVADETGTLFAGNVCNCTTPHSFPLHQTRAMDPHSFVVTPSEPVGGTAAE